MKSVKLKDMLCPPQPFGTVTVGTKGQVVLPKEVRKKMGIKPKDQLLVLLKGGRAIGLIKAGDLKELQEDIEREIQAFRKHLP